MNRVFFIRMKRKVFRVSYFISLFFSSCLYQCYIYESFRFFHFQNCKRTINFLQFFRNRYSRLVFSNRLAWQYFISWLYRHRIILVLGFNFVPSPPTKDLLRKGHSVQEFLQSNIQWKWYVDGTIWRTLTNQICALLFNFFIHRSP